MLDGRPFYLAGGYFDLAIQQTVVVAGIVIAVSRKIHVDLPPLPYQELDRV